MQKDTKQKDSNYEPPIAVAVYKLYLTFSPLIYQFPKGYRYSLAQTINNNILAILELIFEANSLPRPLREAPLMKANAKCEMLKMLARMCFELKLIESTQYFQITADLREIGKMLWGWVRYVRSGPYNQPD